MARTATTDAKTRGDDGTETTGWSLKLWVALARAFALLEERAAEDVARHGLTLAEFGILEALYHKGPMPLSQVQRKILVSSGGITYLVDRLEQQELVRRKPSPDDRRVRLVELTDKGQRFIARAFAEHAEVMSGILSGLDSREQRLATSLLAKLGRHVEELERRVKGEK
jgi:MarR family 2-MHQ and catechol resistance regulon transcriptional repressor